MTVDPNDLSDRTDNPEGVGGDDPIKRYDTFGDAVRAESEGDYKVDQNRFDHDGEDDPKEKLRRIQAAKEGGD